MDLETIEKRIEYLEAYKDRLREEITEKERELTEIQGAIKEMWRFHEKNLEVHEYGGIRYDGRKKVFKLPTFGSPEAIEKGVRERLSAQSEGDAETAKAARIDRGRSDAQEAANRISERNKLDEGMSWD